ncbi:MAG TPA: TraX family protein [Albitalea sp.]|uniref:TraX family protein n=1 Tax=Piscinibacter sp. TaxID=1903157 RepID=UPI002ED0BF23
MQRAPLHIPDGTLEALKWVALLLMLLDHVNTFLFDRTLPGAYQVGRWVAPVFGFVLAYNLARPDALQRGLHLRVMRRLLVFGLLATPPFMALVGRWWPLNILFLLLAGAATIYGLDRGDWAGVAIAAVALGVGGLLAEYFYPGVAMVVAAWAFCRQPDGRHFALWVLFTASLVFLNGNLWALTAVPVLLLAPHVDLRVPRLRWTFYALYPLHLAVLWWIRTR